MSHEVETMAWTNEVPWHGLGNEVARGISTDEALKAAKIDWTVSKQPLILGRRTENGVASTGKVIHDSYALMRDSDNHVLDVVGAEYTPVQNHEAVEFFREFVEDGRAYIETLGSLKGGRMVWVLANLQDSFKLAGKDEVKGFLLMAQPHQQGKAQLLKHTAIRVVCSNTMTAALRGATGSLGMVRRAHRGEFNEEARDRAKQALGIAREQFGEFKEFALKMSKTKVDELRSAQLLAEIFGDDELANEEAIEVIRKEASKATSLAIQALTNAPGAKLLSAQNTAWGVFNAVTYTTDHLIRNSADSRVFNSWFGRSAKIKDQAFSLLTDLD